MKYFYLCLLLAGCVPSPGGARCEIQRDSKGRIERDAGEVRKFKRLTGYPRGRKGYVVDHIVPLCACGADKVSNMQWQRADSARMKDRDERKECAK